MSLSGFFARATSRRTPRDAPVPWRRAHVRSERRTAGGKRDLKLPTHAGGKDSLEQTVCFLI